MIRIISLLCLFLGFVYAESQDRVFRSKDGAMPFCAIDLMSADLIDIKGDAKIESAIFFNDALPFNDAFCTGNDGGMRLKQCIDSCQTQGEFAGIKRISDARQRKVLIDCKEGVISQDLKGEMASCYVVIDDAKIIELLEDGADMRLRIDAEIRQGGL